MRARAFAILAVLAVGGALAFVFRARLAAAAPNELVSAGFFLAVLALLLSGAVGANRLGPAPVRNALMWACIVLSLILAYRLLAPALGYHFAGR